MGAQTVILCLNFFKWVFRLKKNCIFGRKVSNMKIFWQFFDSPKFERRKGGNCLLLSASRRHWYYAWVVTCEWIYYCCDVQTPETERRRQQHDADNVSNDVIRADQSEQRLSAAVSQSPRGSTSSTSSSSSCGVTASSSDDLFEHNDQRGGDTRENSAPAVAAAAADDDDNETEVTGADRPRDTANTGNC